MNFYANKMYNSSNGEAIPLFPKIQTSEYWLGDRGEDGSDCQGAFFGPVYFLLSISVVSFAFPLFVRMAS